MNNAGCDEWSMEQNSTGNDPVRATCAKCKRALYPGDKWDADSEWCEQCILDSLEEIE